MRVVVVGGVAAGMSCATRLRRRSPDAEIIVVERGEYVSFANCGLPYFVGEEIQDVDDLLLQTPESLRSGHALDVRTRTTAVAIDPSAKTITVRDDAGESEISYDELVLAPGATSVMPPVPGIASPRVHTVRSIPDAIGLADAASPESRALVVGGGFIGIETAEALAHRGLLVALVEMADHVLPPVDEELAPLVRVALEAEGVVIVEGTGVSRITDTSAEAVVALDDGSELGVDLVVVAAGVRPDTRIFEDAGGECERGAIRVDDGGRTSLSHVWAAGDAVLSEDAVSGIRRPVALAGPANRAGRLVADAIADANGARRVPRPLGTAILRVGAATVAMTGASRRSLLSAGIAFQSIHLHPANHAAYFPGAAGMSIVAHFSAQDGRLLGAQAVGEEGVDKRIDVLATAIRAGMSAPDLIDLDLSYSPPYGAAKDPVNLVGMIAENVLSGRLRLWYAQDLADVMETSVIVDTRSRAEFASGHIPGALNVPHTEIRARVGEIRATAAGRPVRLHCASGYRSYLAHTVLAGAGLDSASLSGGLQTLRSVLGADAKSFFARGGNG